MKYKLFCLILAMVAALFLNGCSQESDDGESSLPWARPATWQGRLPPGMGCGNTTPGKL